MSINDEERERVKANPESVASRIAWETSSAIAMRTMENGGIYNGRLAAIEIDKAIAEASSAPKIKPVNRPIHFLIGAAIVLAAIYALQKLCQ